MTARGRHGVSTPVADGFKMLFTLRTGIGYDDVLNLIAARDRLVSYWLFRGIVSGGGSLKRLAKKGYVSPNEIKKSPFRKDPDETHRLIECAKDCRAGFSH